jgi:hypothetical protein
MASDDVQLCQQDLETTILVLMSNLTWPREAVREYQTRTIVAGFRQRVEYHRRRGLLLLSNGYSRDFIRSMVQEICFIEVDERCWNSELDWSGGDLTISNFWPKFKMKTQEALNTKLVDVLLRFPTNTRMPHSDKQSNGYSHWKTAWGEIFEGNLETDWVFDDGRRFGLQAKPG